MHRIHVEKTGLNAPNQRAIKHLLAEAGFYFRQLQSLPALISIGALGVRHQAHHHRQPSQSLLPLLGDRKSTRLNSSHVAISYAVFCLKKKKEVILVNTRVINQT